VYVLTLEDIYHIYSTSSIEMEDILEDVKSTPSPRFVDTTISLQFIYAYRKYD